MPYSVYGMLYGMVNLSCLSTDSIRAMSKDE